MTGSLMAGGADTRLRRRGLLVGGASALLLGRAGSGRAEPVLAATLGGDTPGLVVAGPPMSATGDWARSLLPLLNPALTATVGHRRRHSSPLQVGGHHVGGRQIQVRFWGGQDGVTGLNQFEARVLPSGQDALVFPGSAVMAWLTGDPRVAFDGGHLLPLLARVSPGVLMLRGALRDRQAPVRVALPSWAGPALAGFLALDLLQVDAEPVAAPATEAVFQHAVDAVFVHGADAEAHCRALSAVGLSPVFAIGATTADGTPCRDPAFADVPTLQELLGHAGAAQMATIWPAVAGASVLDAALALPALSPAACVACWRRACSAAAAAAGQADADHGLRLLTGSRAIAAAGAMQMDSASQIVLRRWLATRLRLTMPSARG